MLWTVVVSTTSCTFLHQVEGDLLLRLNIMNRYFGEKPSDSAELLSKFKSYQSNSSAVLTKTLFPDLKAWFTSNSRVNLGHKEVLIQMKCQSIAVH